MKKKVPNIEERFEKRPHKLALFAVLCDYYKRYVSDGLPSMECRFSQTLTSIYTEEHPGIEDLLMDCVYEDEGCVVPEKQIVAEMRNRGYDETPKKLKLFLVEKYRTHRFIRKTRPGNVVSWKGLGCHFSNTWA